MDLGQFIIQNFHEFLTYTAFANATVGNLIMIVVGAFFIWLAIKKDFEPLLLVPMASSSETSPSVLTQDSRSVSTKTTPCSTSSIRV